MLVAGGDGTIAWVMAIIKELDLKPVPPIAIIPLGTGEGRWHGCCMVALATLLDQVGRCISIHFPYHHPPGHTQEVRGGYRGAASGCLQDVCAEVCWSSCFMFKLERKLVPPMITSASAEVIRTRRCRLFALAWRYYEFRGHSVAV